VVGLFTLADSRLEQIEKAIRYGKHIIAEKPVADPYIKATADRFRAQKEKINQRRNAASAVLPTKQPVMDKPVPPASPVSAVSIAARNEVTPPIKKQRPAKRKKLI
ncbi:MAG: hypothetical protein KHX68_05450, partial [Roseburia sp.]|nr:hypothetical protein [Roseburia sp.]